MMMIIKRMAIIASLALGFGLLLGEWGKQWNGYSDVAGWMLVALALVLGREWFCWFVFPGEEDD